VPRFRRFTSGDSQVARRMPADFPVIPRSAHRGDRKFCAPLGAEAQLVRCLRQSSPTGWSEWKSVIRTSVAFSRGELQISDLTPSTLACREPRADAPLRRNLCATTRSKSSRNGNNRVGTLFAAVLCVFILTRSRAYVFSNSTHGIDAPHGLFRTGLGCWMR